MARRILWLVMVWLLAASPVCAQILPIPPAPRDVLDDWAPTIPPFRTGAVFEPPESYLPDSFTFWARTEYLLGWVRSTPMPLPVATTGATTAKVPGAIGQSGTTVLLGNANTYFRVLSGMRFTTGVWFDQGNTVGVQVTGYVQEVGVQNFQAISNSTGTPLYGVPYVSVTPKGNSEAVVLISNPKKLAGYINIQSNVQRWGEDVSGLWCFYREPGLSFTALVGARHEELLENFNLQAVSLPVVGTSVAKTYADRFTTRNQFFGSQIGGNVFVQRGAFFLDATFKLGLGATQQYVEIQGLSSQVVGRKLTTFPGGIFAQPSNSGHFTASSFTAMPVLETKVGYQFTPRVRTFIGYDILYWNGVVRPGNQIDRNINISQDPILGATKGVPTGPTAPNPQFNRSGFWAQAINFGVDFRF